ncbi:hypothetical protein JG688_00011990 [Phytophthora aleatoria]|uniref:RXLR phytopathogen effector protein WY-domain domain-containing protein n=1 Tax=Phytophthora aleatoria TaxID=2496075 RepID=A0A8J5INK2_9STRA|nr:hypothetical protein JG688_00011990 [Phytophthora aleatoria]
MFVQWLEYIKLYRTKMAFSDSQLVHFLLDTNHIKMSQASFAVLFQSIKDIPDLKKLAESVQTRVFQRNVHTHPKFQTLEAFTVQYAAHYGDKTVLENVKKLFASNDPKAAIAAAMKASEDMIIDDPDRVIASVACND